MDIQGKTVIGLIEKVTIKGRNTVKTVMAKIDTGATKNSIDSRLALELSLGPIVETKLVKSAHGNSVRPIIRAEIELAGKKMITRFSLADRTHLKYRVLIGQNGLKDRGFLIDPSKISTITK